MDTTVCPLCGAKNDCQVALGKDACWCFSTTVPAEVLARLPADARHAVCVCRTCLATAEAPEQPAISPHDHDSAKL